jgi:prepilin signal peptidase PulO-like enzyme (type II secretory pathway)
MMIVWSGSLDGLDGLGMLVGFSYAGGLPFAFLAWMTILILQQWRVRFEPLYVTLVGLAAGLMFRAVVVYLFGTYEPTENGAPTPAWVLNVCLISIGLIPTLVCWWLSSRFDITRRRATKANVC